MTYEKMTGAINLEELEVQAEDVVEVSAGRRSISKTIHIDDPDHPCFMF